MSFDYKDSVEKLKAMDPYDLIGIIAAHNEPTVVLHARHIYESRQRDEQRKYEAEQVELKHKLERENIDYQHSVSKQIVEQQIEILRNQTKTMWRTAILASVSTVVASLSAVYLAYTLSKIQKPPQLQTQTTTSQISQIQSSNESSKPAASIESKNGKVPSEIPPHKRER